MSAPPEIAAPLAGTRVLVTRARAQAGELRERLEVLGAEVLELPVIEIVPAVGAELDAALRRLGVYDWVVFTSVNAVGPLVERLAAVEGAREQLAGRRIAAIGPATAERLRAQGFAVELVPERFVAEALVEALVERGVRGKRFLLPRADIARDVLPEGLRAAGATVDVVVAYRTRAPELVDGATLRRVRDGEVDVITFASPSTVRNLAALLGDELPAASVICIGPITAAAAGECGFEVAAEAEEYSIPGLVDTVVRLVGERRGEKEGCQ